MFARFFERLLAIFNEPDVNKGQRDFQLRVILDELHNMVTAEGLVDFNDHSEAEKAVALAHQTTTIEPIITPAELAKMQETYRDFIKATAQREEETVNSLRDILNRVRTLKAFSGYADVPQQASDEWWREADLLQADAEVALDRLAPEALSEWLQSRW